MSRPAGRVPPAPPLEPEPRGSWAPAAPTPPPSRAPFQSGAASRMPPCLSSRSSARPRMMTAEWGGSQAWGPISESLHSTPLARGDVKTQEEGTGHLKEEREVMKGCLWVLAQAISDQLFPE